MFLCKLYLDRNIRILKNKSHLIFTIKHDLLNLITTQRYLNTKATSCKDSLIFDPSQSSFWNSI